MVHVPRVFKHMWTHSRRLTFLYSARVMVPSLSVSCMLNRTETTNKNTHRLGLTSEGNLPPSRPRGASCEWRDAGERRGGLPSGPLLEPPLNVNNHSEATPHLHAAASDICSDIYARALPWRDFKTRMSSSGNVR